MINSANTPGTSLEIGLRREPETRRSDARRMRRVMALATAGLALGAVTLLGGCKKEPPPAPVVVNTPPPAPPPPPPIATIQELMTRYGIDERVRLAEEQAPDGEEARVAVLQFFDAFVRGDATTAGSMMSLPDQLQLEAMQADGTWATATEGIRRVDLQAGRSPLGDIAVLAVFHVGRGFEPQLWTLQIEDNAPSFSAEPTPPGIMNQLSGTDWIGAWYRILNDELARADEPDEVITIPQQSFDTKSDIESAMDAGGGGPGQGPGSPGKRPVRQPVAPPGGAPEGTPN